MFKFLGFGKRKPPTSSQTARTSTRPGHDSISPESRGVTLQHSDVQRELVRVVLKDTLRLHGIPAGWIACEVTGISHRNMDDELFVHLIIMQWNDALIRYAPALQGQLIQGLDRFEPGVDHSSYVVSWMFSPNCKCPYTQMPDPRSWSQTLQAQPTTAPTLTSAPRPAAPLAPPAAQTPAAGGKPKFDLPPSAMDDRRDNDFAPTEPSAMR